jgi:uncharacterized protein YpmS
MIYRQMRILCVVAVLILSALACNLPANRTETPPTAAPLTTEEMQQFEDRLQSTLENTTPGGEVTLHITEQELNSYIAAQLQAEPNQMITNPRLRFTADRVELYAQVTQASLTAEAVAVIIPGVSADGTPQFDIESMTVGSIPVPEALMDQVEDLIDATMRDYLAANGASFKVSSIDVSEGQLIVTGTPQ